MSNTLLQFGAVFAPLGFTASFFAIQFLDGWKMIVSLIFSFAIMLFGFWSLSSAIKWAKIEDKENDLKFTVLIQEIKMLRRDIAKVGGLHGQNQSNSTQTKTSSSDNSIPNGFDDLESKP